MGRLLEQTALCRHVAPLSLVCEQLPNFSGDGRGVCVCVCGGGGGGGGGGGIG